jgi:hypothetical protein
MEGLTEIEQAEFNEYYSEQDYAFIINDNDIKESFHTNTLRLGNKNVLIQFCSPNKIGDKSSLFYKILPIIKQPDNVKIVVKDCIPNNIVPKFKPYDTVKLLEKFNNDMLFTVVEYKNENTVRVFPKAGGMLCSSHEDNLILVVDDSICSN